MANSIFPRQVTDSALDGELWAQFGIAGMILFAFLIILLIVLHMNAKTIRAIVERAENRSKEDNIAWREVFSTWSKNIDTRQGETNQVMKETNLVIREMTKAVENNNTCMMLLGAKDIVSGGKNERSEKTDYQQNHSG